MSAQCPCVHRHYLDRHERTAEDSFSYEQCILPRNHFTTHTGANMTTWSDA